MSFRTRLTTFFVLIVVVPMIAMGVLMFRLIGDSQQGKADARASGLASAAASLYQSEAAAARADAQALARAVGRSKSDAVATHFANLARQAGLARATLSTGLTVLADVGDNIAIAPGAALLKTPTAAQPMTVTVSEVTASQYAHDLAAPGVVVAVHAGPRLLARPTTSPPAGHYPRMETSPRAEPAIAQLRRHSGASTAHRSRSRFCRRCRRRVRRSGVAAPSLRR